MTDSIKPHNLHRQTLVRTEVVNPSGEASQRYIDRQVFTLWKHYVEHRHGLRVKAPLSCVWVPADEVRRQDRLFAAAAHRCSVQKLCFECYDAKSGITEEKTRFVPEEDVDAMVDRLMQHLSRNCDFTTLTMASGEAIATHTTAPPAKTHSEFSWSIPRGFAPVRSAMRS